MAISAYPHMIFGSESAGLDKDRLVTLLGECAPGGEAEQSALKVTWAREGYAWTFWFEDAERVGEMYAAYLPEGARRRPLINATTVIDMSGAADEAGEHAGEADAIVRHLAEQEGVYVFSEASKRFVGMSYGDEVAESETTPAEVTPAEVAPGASASTEASPVGEQRPEPTPAPAPAPSPTPIETPQVETASTEASPVEEQHPEPTPVEIPTGETPMGDEQPQVAPAPTPAPERVPGQVPAAPDAEPAPVERPIPAPAPERIPGQVAPAAEAQPQQASPHKPEEEKGFFKKLFGRR